MSENKVNLVLMLIISFLFAAFWIPIAMSFMNAANMTDWSLPVKVAFTVLMPIIFIVAIAIAFVPKGKKRR
jgi:hypothetical protein